MRFTEAFCIMIVCGISHANTVSKLYDTPPHMDHFEMDWILGKWYLAYTFNPCSWKGADEFEDWAFLYNRGYLSSSIRSIDTWRRDGEETRTTISRKFTKGSKYVMKDAIGDVISGNAIIVATDYTSFLIAWGCTKQSIKTGKCSDPWISVKTRQSNPSQRTTEIINAILNKIWGITSTDLIKVIHSKL